MGLVSGRTVLLTGASGFVGRTVHKALSQSGWSVRATGYRNASEGLQRIAVSSDTDWSEAIEGCSAVVHLAGRAHVLRESSANPISAFRQVNTEGTLTLARAAANAGVRRLVFLSSVAVHQQNGEVLREAAGLDPQTPYGVSKLEAELGLVHVAERTGLEVTILRAPLIYGPNVGARFLQLLQWCRAGFPMPFGAVRNARSFVGVHNLADAILIGLEHPSAANRAYLVADTETISTPELVQLLARLMDRPSHLVPVPIALLRTAAQMLGRRSEIERLIGSLVVDTQRIRHELGWNAPLSLERGLAETAAWYMAGAAS